MRIDVVHAALGVVFGDEDHHVAPPGRAREKLDNAAQGIVVVGHEGGGKGITIHRARLRQVVVGQVDVKKARQLLPGIDVVLLHVLNKLRGAKLIGNVGVVVGIRPGRVLVKRRGHRHVRDVARARRLQARAFVGARQFKAFAVVTERNAIALQMMPDGAGL